MTEASLFDGVVEWTIPVATASESNLRGHWAKHANRRRAQRNLAQLVTGFALKRFRWDRVVSLQLVRLAPRRLDAGNLASALKHVQDGVCDAVGINDGNAAIAWSYDQERAKAVGVRVRMTIAFDSTA